MGLEAILAAGYAIILVAAAGVLEWLSRHAHSRSEEHRTGGFTYEKHHDYWVCQQGEQLWPVEFDRERRLVKYKAKSSACRTCAIKDLCTSSDDGREVTRALDPWPHSEAGRFHRGIAVMVAALGLFILGVGLARNHAIAEIAVLVPLFGAVGWAVWWLARDLLHTPTGFPEIKPAHGNRLRPGIGEEGHMSDRGDMSFGEDFRAEELGVPRFGRERVIKWKAGKPVTGSKADTPAEFEVMEDPAVEVEEKSSRKPPLDEPYGRGATITAN